MNCQRPVQEGDYFARIQGDGPFGQAMALASMKGERSVCGASPYKTSCPVGRPDAREIGTRAANGPPHNPTPKRLFKNTLPLDFLRNFGTVPFWNGASAESCIDAK